MTQNISQQQTMSELLKAIENNDICSVKKHLPSLHIEEDNSLPLLEAIKENAIQIVDELIPYCLTANNCATVMNTAIAYWRGELLKTLIATPVFQNNTIEGPLLQAVRRGQTDNVKLLIPYANFQGIDSEALEDAAYEGYLELATLLLPLCDPKANDSAALRGAALMGKSDIVKLLIPVSNPKDVSCEAFKNAAESGSLECVQLLLPHSDSETIPLALFYAANSRNKDVIQFLLPLCDYKEVCRRLIEGKITHTDIFQRCVEEHEALLLKERLHNVLNGVVDSAKNNKRKM